MPLVTIPLRVVKRCWRRASVPRFGDVDESIDVERYLDGVRYPATKQQLVAWAYSNGAVGRVLEGFHSLQDREYESAYAVKRALLRA
jgi:Protein of unknown function (DUF2795)